MDSVLKSLCLSKVENLPSVRVPGTNTFFRAADLGHMEIITWSKLCSLRFETSSRLVQLNARLKFLEQSKGLDEKQRTDEIKHIRDELSQLTQKTEIVIDINPKIEYIQIFPINLVDCAFIIKGSLPKFVSKIPGAAHHLIGKIISKYL